MSLIAQAIARLLRWRTVISEAIGLDHKTKVRPVEVDFEPVETYAGDRSRQLGSDHKPQKAALELRVGEPKGASSENRLQWTDSALAGIPVQSLTERLGVNQVEPVRLVDRPLQASPVKTRGKIEESAHHARDRDTVAADNVGYR
jgi:hypothetical protein